MEELNVLFKLDPTFTKFIDWRKYLLLPKFTEDENLCIKISNNEQFKSVIQQYLNLVISSCKDEEIIDGMLECKPRYIWNVILCSGNGFYGNGKRRRSLF